MSTTKEKEVIWEENALIEPMKKSGANGVSEECDIIINTGDLKENDPSKDITESKRKAWRIRERKKYQKRKNNPYYINKWKTRKLNHRRIHYFRYMAMVLRDKCKVGYKIKWNDLYKIAKSQKLVCPLTNRKLTRENISVDHKIPLSKGGTNDPSNLRFIDYHANLAKAMFTDEELRILATDIINTIKRKLTAVLPE